MMPDLHVSVIHPDLVGHSILKLYRTRSIWQFLSSRTHDPAFVEFAVPTDRNDRIGKKHLNRLIFPKLSPIGAAKRLDIFTEQLSERRALTTSQRQNPPAKI